jgi:peptidyl-prolyl cis-trans isomerase D
MLQHMRDNSKGVISGILIGLLVIIFAVSGAEALFKWDASSKKALSVNGETISELDVLRAIANRKQQLISRFGESVPADFLTDEKLRQPSIDGLIERSLLVQQAKKGGLAASKEKIDKEILATTAFQKEGGVFDQTKFVQLLAYQDFTPISYRKILAEDAMVTQFESGIVRSAFVTPAELKYILGLSFQTRDFSYLVLPAAKATASVVVEEADIKSHYDASPQAFTTPERVAVDYIELSVTDLMKDIVVSDEQVVKQYQQNAKSFVAKTERQAAHILLEGDAQKRAEEIKAKLTAGEDFATLAKEYSSDAGSKEQGGDLGFSSGEAFPKEFESALALLKIGEISAPVKTDAGTHIIKLLSERGSAPASLEESKVTILDQMKRAEAESQFAVKLGKLRDLSYNAENLADVAKELNLSVKNSGLFTKTGGADLMANSSFINAAFSPEVLEQGNSSDVIELETNRMVVLKKTDRKPSQLEPLELVKEKIITLVRAEKAAALLISQAKDVMVSLGSGISVDELAKQANLTAKSAAAITRNDTNTDREVLQFVFTLASPVENKPTLGKVKLASGDLAVVSLGAVNLGTEDKVPEEQRKSISAQLASINGGYDMKSVQTHLQEVAKIKRK